jgi:VWFA-related protein
MARRARQWIALLFWLAAAAAQTPPNESPTFRAGTELVQVSVVAQDKRGKPVPDLLRDEFQIFDNGTPREVRLFLSEKSNPSPPQPLPPNTFANGSHSGYSVLLFDNLATEFAYPESGASGVGFARQKALQALRTIPAGDKIAIYGLWRKLQIFREFTTDRDSLVRQLTAMGGSVDTPDRNNCAPDMNVTINGEGPEVGAARARAIAECHRLDGLQRARSIDEELGQVADHLAGIPGRKNLIWLAGVFQISPAALQKFTNAGVAIYPVDVRASMNTPAECDKSSGYAAMRALAAVTGGVAFYCRHDLDAAIGEAMEDGRIVYTLGFYQSGDAASAGVHRLGVRVSRPGVTLRYRTSYKADPPHPPSADPVADLVQALNRPVDSSAISVRASVTPTQNGLNLEARLDVENLDLIQEENLAPRQLLWKGRVEVVARFVTADGIVASDVFHQTVTLNLRLATYDIAVRDGLAYHTELNVPAKAVELKLLFANPASGKIGTLTIPLPEIAAK